MRKLALVILVSSVFGTIAFAQGDGLGGVLTRDVPISHDDDDRPSILPAGGLVAFGFGNDWSATRRKDGQIQIHFIVQDEDGDVDMENAWVAEDAVQTFTWACGEPIERRLNPDRPVICSPFVNTGFFGTSTQWTLKFVTEARKLVQSLDLPLVEEFSVTYEGGGARSPSTGTVGMPGPADKGSCTVDQILKMKEAGLSDEQIKAACGE